MITLYLVTHKVTKLKYFGKTASYHTAAELQKYYHGSGKYWKNHLKKHGDDVTIQILHSSDDKFLIKSLAIMYSKFWNIVKSKNYANLKAENGLDGGDTSKFIDYKKINHIGKNNSMYGRTGGMSGKKHSDKAKQLIREANIGNKNPMFGKTFDNPMAKITEIFNSNNELKYTCNGNFYQTCIDKKLPYSVLLKYINTKKGLYQNKKPNNKDFLKFKGWYATNE